MRRPLVTIGLIPDAEGFTKVFENTAGYQLARAVGNSAGYRGVVATQYGMKVVPQAKGAVAMVNGAFGLGDTSVEGRISTGLTVAGFIPGLGSVAFEAPLATFVSGGVRVPMFGGPPTGHGGVRMVNYDTGVSAEVPGGICAISPSGRYFAGLKGSILSIYETPSGLREPIGRK